MANHSDELFTAMEAAHKALGDHLALVRASEPGGYAEDRDEEWTAEHRALDLAYRAAMDAWFLAVMSTAGRVASIRGD